MNSNTICFRFFFKETNNNNDQRYVVFIGNDFNNDDIIYISGREARIVRVGITKTVFYMTDRGTKMIVPNEKLKDLTMEKILNTGHPLAKNGYLTKSTDELSEKEKQGLHAVAEEISVRD